MFPDENKNRLENDDPAVGGNGGMVLYYGSVLLCFTVSTVLVYEALLRPKDKNRSLAVGLLVCMFALQ